MSTNNSPGFPCLPEISTASCIHTPEACAAISVTVVRIEILVLTVIMRIMTIISTW